MAEGSGKGGWIAAVVALAAIAVVVLLVVRAQQLPEGPVPVAWDRESCAHCHMHVGDPSFAAQLHTKEGQILHFDDPGCLLLYREANDPDVHAIWFHHVNEERWIAGDDVAFVATSPTPMEYGLGAVDRGAQETVGPSEALQQVHAIETRGRGEHR